MKSIDMLGLWPHIILISLALYVMHVLNWYGQLRSRVNVLVKLHRCLGLAIGAKSQHMCIVLLKPFLTSHLGCVLSIKFSSAISAQYFASGLDNRNIIIIYKTNRDSCPGWLYEFIIILLERGTSSSGSECCWAGLGFGIWDLDFRFGLRGPKSKTKFQNLNSIPDRYDSGTRFQFPPSPRPSWFLYLKFKRFWKQSINGGNSNIFNFPNYPYPLPTPQRVGIRIMK